MTDDNEYTAWKRMFASNLQKNGIVFPSIDLYFTLCGNILKKTAAAVSVLNSVARRDSNQSPFQGIYIIAPKGNVPLEAVLAYIMDEGQSHSNVHLWEVDQLSTSSLLDRLTQCPEHSAVIFLQGSLYVSESVQPSLIDSDTKYTLSEDLWAPQLHHLLQNIEEINTKKNCYIIVDSGERFPGQRKLQAPFMSLESVAIISDEGSARRNEVLAQNLPQWTQMLDRGRIGSVLQSIEALPEDFDDDKPYLRIQFLQTAGLAGNALDELEKLDLNHATVEITLKMAKIAAEAGGFPMSLQLLMATQPRLLSIPDYEVALAIARILNNSSLQKQISDQYLTRYPLQSSQRRRNLQHLISAGQFKDAIDVSRTIDISTDTQAALEFCHKHLPTAGVPDYALAVRSLRSTDSWSETAFVWIVQDALRRHLLIHAFEITFGDSQPANIQTIGQHAFTVIRELLLAINSAGDFPIHNDRVHNAIGALIRFVAAYPAQPAWRFEIENLLSHKVTGKLGLVLLLHKIINAPSPAINIQANQAPLKYDKDAVTAALKFLEERLMEEELVVAGRLVFPPGTFTNDIADGIIAVARTAVEQIITESPATDSKVTDLLSWVSIASIVVPHSTQPNADLELYRQTAGHLATTGHPQQARNLIDMVLLSTESADSVRCREAWFVCADTYSRLDQKHQSLVAVACGLNIEAKIDYERAFREADLCTRLLRDNGLPQLAIPFHQRSGELLRLLQLYESQEIQHEYVGFTIEQRVLIEERIDQIRLLDLIKRMHLNARKVLERNAPPLPMALLLGQTILIAERENITVPLEAKKVCDLLRNKLTGYEADLYQQVATTQASTTGLLHLLQTTESARYARDAAFDTNRVSIAARRLLAGTHLDSSDTLFALELLSDRGTPLPGWQTTAKPYPQLSSILEPRNWAIELSQRDIDIVVIGFDEQGRVHAVMIHQGELIPPKNLDETFSSQGFLNWTKEFPYRYGIDEEALNLFHISTEGLNFPFDLKRATAVIASNRLQQLPPTLYRLGEKFSGQLQPIFSAPSLGWLYNASSNPASTNKRLTGWISIADQLGRTLVITKGRLEETINKHSIELNTDETLPDGFWGSELSLVVAHGSVLPKDKFFQRVSDEGTLRVTTEDFAKAFRNVGVVVLFVCSAGRADLSPEGESTYGLAKELLNQGCSAVIASPWPLDSRVPSHWFPTFMDEWSKGANLATATFLANQQVAINFSSDFAHSLAMTVFGDGLRLRMR